MKSALFIVAVVFAAAVADLYRRTFNMARAIDQLRTDIKELNEATNELASVVTDLRDKVKVDMTADEVAEVQAALDAATDRLKGLAADPNQPVP